MRNRWHFMREGTSGINGIRYFPGNCAGPAGEKCRVNTLATSVIECPECRTRYELPLAIPDKGRKVRCSKCAFVWVAMPSAPEPEAKEPDGLDDIIMRSESAETQEPQQAVPEPPPQPQVSPSVESTEAVQADAPGDPDPAPAVEDRPADEAVREPRVSDIYEAEPQADSAMEDDLDVEFAAEEFSAAVGGSVPAAETSAPSSAASAAAGDRPRRRSPLGLAAGWVLLFAAAGGIAYGAVAGREHVVSLLPGAAGIYARLGMPVNVRGLEFRKVAYDWTAVAGRQLLEVTGEVVNVSDQPRSVPMIEIALRDADNAEVYQWAEEVRSRPLAAGEAAVFRASLDSPPKGVVNLQVRFARSR